MAYSSSSTAEQARRFYTICEMTSNLLEDGNTVLTLYRRRLSHFGSVLALVTIATACVRSEPPSSLALDLPSYVLSHGPTLLLEDDGTPERSFARVTVRRMPTGEIVVADRGASSIQLFGRDGALIRTLARHGKGPGEVDGEFTLTAIADTLVTFGQPPMAAPDVNLYSATSGFLARIRPSASNARVFTPFGRLTTGEFVVKRGSGFSVLEQGPPLGALLPDSAVYGILRSDSETDAQVVWLPPVVSEWLYTYRWRNSRLGSGAAPYPLGPVTLALVSGCRFWLVDGGTGVLRAFDGAGHEVVSRTIALPLEDFDRAAIARRREAAMDAAAREVDTARAEALYDPDLLPATMPLVSSAVAGPDGEVWLRLFELDATAPQRYLVVNKAGIEIAQVVVPNGLQVEHVGHDFVLGIVRDELGVESVVEYALRRE